MYIHYVIIIVILYHIPLQQSHLGRVIDTSPEKIGLDHLHSCMERAVKEASECFTQFSVEHCVLLERSKDSRHINDNVMFRESIYYVRVERALKFLPRVNLPHKALGVWSLSPP